MYKSDIHSAFTTTKQLIPTTRRLNNSDPFEYLDVYIYSLTVCVLVYACSIFGYTITLVTLCYDIYVLFFVSFQNVKD